MIIYKTTNLLNGKFYIGQDTNNNPEYLGSGFILKRAIKKYGNENFIKEILELCSSKQQMNEKEIYWIDKLKANIPDIGYNIANGGQGGNLFTDEIKIAMGIFDKISKAHKNKPQSNDHNKAITEGLNNYYKNSKRNQKLKLYDSYAEEEKKKRKIGKYNPCYGKKYKLNENILFRYWQKGITPANAYWIIDIDTGIEYHGARLLSEQFGNPNTARRAIVQVCKGQREHFQGRKFKFKDF